jgi:hypothetical protein
MTITVKYKEFPRPNKYPILVRIKSPLLLYVFYEDCYYLYFGEKKRTYDGSQLQPRVKYDYELPIDLKKEIEMCTEGAGGKILRYNEKYERTYSYSDGTPPSIFKEKKHPIAMISYQDDIVLLYKTWSELFGANGYYGHTTYSNIAKECEEKKRYSFQEIEMYKDNGFKILI